MSLNTEGSFRGRLRQNLGVLPNGCNLEPLGTKAFYSKSPSVNSPQAMTLACLEGVNSLLREAAGCAAALVGCGRKVAYYTSLKTYRYSNYGKAFPISAPKDFQQASLLHFCRCTTCAVLPFMCPAPVQLASISEAI